MNRSLRVVGAILGLFFSTGLATGFAFGQEIGVAPPLNQTRQREIRAFSVGVAVVKEPFSAAPSKPFVGRFSLPSGTVLETLQAYGLRTSLVRRITTDEPFPILMEGDQVRIFVDFEGGTSTFEGAVINPEGWGFQQGDTLCIQSKEGDIACLPRNEIAAVSILSVKEGVAVPERLQEDRPLIVEVQGTPETPLPYLTYLVRGALSWEPLYMLELTTGELSAFASTENGFDFGQAKVTFVMGEPLLVEGYFKEPVRGLGVEAMAAAVPPLAPQQVGEFWEYSFEGTVEIKKGESLRLPLFEGRLILKDVYTWNGGPVFLKHEFTNTLDRPLAEGRVECYEEGLWVGEDTLPWVAVSKKGDVTSQYAKDIEVKEKITRQVETKDKRTMEKELSITNHKREPIFIEIIRDLPYRSNLTFADPKPEVDGNTLTWRLDLKPGDTRTLRYGYEELVSSRD